MRTDSWNWCMFHSKDNALSGHKIVFGKWRETLFRLFLVFNSSISVFLPVVLLDCQSSFQEYSREWEGDTCIFHLHGEEQQEQAGPEIRRQQATRLKINQAWNKRDLEGTCGIVHFRYIKTVKVYCKFFLNAVSGWQKKNIDILMRSIWKHVPSMFPKTSSLHFKVILE